MTEIPHKPTNTVDLIYKSYESAQLLEPPFRQHLGASIIGDPCRRALWYTFRGATRPNFPGRVLRLFLRGQNEEATFSDDLRGIGCDLHTVDPETGEQFRVTECGGHFGGSLDGACTGLPESPATWHVVEMKTHGDKSFKSLAKDGVEQSKPMHYAQMQVYMLLTRMKRALYLAVNKNDDALYAERIHRDAAFGKKLIEKAQTIIDAKEPLERISEDPAWYECKWCSHQGVCHQQRVPEVHCRTCAHVTPEPDGTWSCQLNPTDRLSYEDQQRGCGDHLFIPALIPYAEMTEYIEGVGVEYKMADGRRFVNCIDGKGTACRYTSKELKEIDPALIGDAGLDQVRVETGGRVVAR